MNKPIPSTPALSAGAAPGPASILVAKQARKRKLTDVADLKELEELREWKRRTDEQSKAITKLLSSSSSCMICLETRPDLVSYGSCGHGACAQCVMEHVTKNLMCLRKPSGAGTGGSSSACRVRLSSFALFPEDAEYSCPMCRQGQLDLMGAGLSLMPDFAYHQLVAFCNAPRSASPSKTALATLPLLPPVTAAVPGLNLGALSETKRQQVLAQLEQDRLNAQKMLTLTAATVAPTGTSPCKQISCPFCGLTATQTVLPTQVLRHIWKCPKRIFHCGFADCGKTFTWEPVYAKAPATVGATGDFKSESKWLELVNAAFKHHMATACTTKVTCCIGWCDWSRHARLSLCEFEAHEKRHKQVMTQFQPIVSLTDRVHTMERLLMQVMRSEFNALSQGGTLKQALVDFAAPVAAQTHASLMVLSDYFTAQLGTGTSATAAAATVRPASSTGRCPFHRPATLRMQTRSLRRGGLERELRDFAALDVGDGSGHGDASVFDELTSSDGDHEPESTAATSAASEDDDDDDDDEDEDYIPE